MKRVSENKLMKPTKHRHTIPRREQQLMERMHKDRQQTLKREHDWCMHTQSTAGTTSHTKRDSFMQIITAQKFRNARCVYNL